MPHECIDGHFYYSPEEGEKMAGKTVICSSRLSGEKPCDGVPCKHYHDHPHIYKDLECCSDCYHKNRYGICVEVE
jgi:hypothetical protein